MFGRLEALTLKEFIEEERADDHLWMFLHIPKTAGSSFGNELARARRPYRNIHIDYTDTSTPAPQQMDRAVQNFISELQTEPFRSCSGHFNIRHADEIAASFPRTRLITFLRDPVARVVSDYRYARTPAHPPHKEFIARFPTFESYVESPGQNKMFRLLTGDPRMAVPDALKLIDERYAFIGVVEMYPMSFNVIFRLFGKDQMPEIYKRRTETTEDNVLELSPELEEKIRAANPKDMAIYEHVRRRLASKRQEWLSMGKAAAPVEGVEVR